MEWLGSELRSGMWSSWAVDSGVTEEPMQVHLHVHAAEAAMDVVWVRDSLAWHATPNHFVERSMRV